MNPSNHDESAPHWASQYIGLPWVAGSSDCWSFARRVWRERFGWDVAVIDVDATSRLASLRAFDDHPEYGHWQSVSEPREGDACLMGKSERPSHIGIYLQANGGGVLHSLEIAGVVFTPVAALPSVAGTGKTGRSKSGDKLAQPASKEAAASRLILGRTRVMIAPLLRLPKPLRRA